MPRLLRLISVMLVQVSHLNLTLNLLLYALTSLLLVSRTKETEAGISTLLQAALDI